jgi:site-specific recombinase XerD
VQQINGRGARWHRRIRGVGQTKAARVLAWLAVHQATLGTPLGDPAAAGRTASGAIAPDQAVAPACAVRPLESFVVPPALDGRAGHHRRPAADCRLPIATDREAVEAWLAEKQQRAGQRRRAVPTASDPAPGHTARAYRREAERFLLWAVLARGKALSSIDEHDCAAYRSFLGDPQPRAQWCAARVQGRWSPLWRPFSGPLSSTAQRMASATLSSLYAYLVDARYVWSNPWRQPALVAPQVPAVETAVMSAAVAHTLPAVRSAAPPLDARRSLSPALWSVVQRHAATLAPTGVNRRLQFALHWLYATGLRVSEAVEATIDDLHCVPTRDGEPPLWWLRVAPGSPRTRQVPVPPEAIDALSAYLTSRGLDAEPHAHANRGASLFGQAADRAQRAPHLPRVPDDSPRRGVQAGTLSRQLKRFFGDCAVTLAEAGDNAGARHLARASTHWLRHTHARHLIERGLPLPVAQRHLGHAARATTASYLLPDDRDDLDAWRSAWSAARAAADQSP